MIGAICGFPVSFSHGSDETLLEVRNGIQIERAARAFGNVPEVPLGPEGVPELREL
jgi:hypothetical protein